AWTAATRRGSLRERLAGGVAQEHRAQAPSQDRELRQLFLEAGPGLGIALADIWQQHLPEQDRLTFGEHAVHPEVPRLHATGEEAGRDARDLERVGVVARLAARVARRSDQAVALELRHLRVVEPGI